MIQINHQQDAVRYRGSLSNCDTVAPCFRAHIDSRMDFSLHNIAVPVNRQQRKPVQWASPG